MANLDARVGAGGNGNPEPTVAGLLPPRITDAAPALRRTRLLPGGSMDGEAGLPAKAFGEKPS